MGRLVKNKKADGLTFFGEHIINIVVGALVLVALVYLGILLYISATKNNDLESAKNTLGNIEAAINSLQEGETKTVGVYGPKDWYIIGIDRNLCFCPNLADKQVCFNEENSVCKVFKDNSINMVHNCWVSQEIGGLSSCFWLNKVPIALFLKKESGIVGIYLEGEYEKRIDGPALFEKFLEFKNSASTKTIKELAGEYVNNRDSSTKKELNRLIALFFSENNLFGEVYITDIATGRSGDVYMDIDSEAGQKVEGEVAKGERQSYSSSIEILGEDGKKYKLTFTIIKK